jgi:hypothetical protein
MKKVKVENNWLWNGESFTGDISEWYGFVYLIEENLTGKKYIGEKSFFSFKVPKGKVNKKKEESEWKHYPSSNKELSTRIKKSLNKNEDYKFTILALCKDKSVMHFEEARWIFHYGCMESDNWYNENVKINILCTYKDYSGRVTRSSV